MTNFISKVGVKGAIYSFIYSFTRSFIHPRSYNKTACTTYCRM